MTLFALPLRNALLGRSWVLDEDEHRKAEYDTSIAPSYGDYAGHRGSHVISLWVQGSVRFIGSG